MRRHPAIWILGVLVGSLCLGLPTRGMLSPPAANAATLPSAATGFSFPVAVSTDHRYLVDGSGAPYLIVGDSPHSLFVNTSLAEADAYLADRQAHGFNAIWVQALCNSYTGGNSLGATYDGLKPFTTNGDFATPNTPYWDRVDAIVQLAANHGITVFLDPVDLAGWIGAVNDNGPVKDRAFGAFLGTRYRGFPNIVWLNGNDFQTWRSPTDDANALAIAEGIAATDPNHLQTVELDYNRSTSLDDQNWVPTVALNAAYTYYPTYDEVLHGYYQHPTTPVFMVEANYEGENNTGGPATTDETLRRQEWWTMTSGATGQLYGNSTTWTFPSGWASKLDTPAVAQLGVMRDFMISRPWQNLTPDATFITSGHGTYSSDAVDVLQSDYATAAVTPDGEHAVAYIPTQRTVTVDTSVLAPTTVARWVDPTTGATQPATAPYQSPGAHADGSADWVLAFDTPRPADTAGGFVPVGPTRILDTRTGTGARHATVGARHSVNLQVTGVGGIPTSNVSAVVLNTTVTNPTRSGYLTVYPTGHTRPTTSNLNFTAGQTIPNLVTVPVGAGGKITLYNGTTGTLNLIGDIAGYYIGGSVTAPGGFVPVGPTRILDTRTGTGARHATVGARHSVNLQVTGVGGIPTSNVSAVVLNTTVTNPTRSGYLTVYPTGHTRPTTSNLNFTAGQTIPNLVTVPVGAGGKITLYNGTTGTLNLIGDIAGYYIGGSVTAPGGFVPVGPTRILDTRTGTGARHATVGARHSVNLQVTGVGGIPTSNVSAVVLNTTVTNPTRSGYLTVYPTGHTRPTTSNLNFTAGQTIPNLVTVPVGAGGKITLYNGTTGTLNLIGDIAGDDIG